MGAIENEVCFASLVAGGILLKMIEARVSTDFPLPARNFYKEEVLVFIQT